MVRALRTGIMLLTLLLVVVGGTGIVSVCPCHEEIFIFSCSCHQDAAPCECHGDDVPRTGSSSPLAGHLCEHRQLEINDLTVPVPHAPLHHLARPLLLISQTSDSATPVPPDPFRNTGPTHEGFQLPLLI